MCHRKQVAKKHAIFVDGLRLAGGDAPIGEEALVLGRGVAVSGGALENSEDRIGIACVQH
jgi:hypothetical protein